MEEFFFFWAICKLCATELALDEFFFLWAARKLGHRGESGIGERLQPPQLRHLGAGVGQLLEATQAVQGGGRISGGGGCPLLGPLGIGAAAPSAASSLLAVSLAGSGSGLMGGSGSSHGQSKFCCHFYSLLRSATTGEITPRWHLAKVRPWTRVPMAGHQPAQQHTSLTRLIEGRSEPDAEGAGQQATPIADAVAFVDPLLASPGVQLAALGPEWLKLRQLCLDKQLAGNDLPDAPGWRRM